MGPDSDREENGTRDESQLLQVQVRRSKFPITVEPIVFAVFFADTLGEPVTTNLVLWRTCQDHFHYNKSICNELTSSTGNKSEIEALIQPYSATVLTAMSFLSVFLPAITSLFIGPWTDHNGRKLVLTIPALGYTLKYVLLIALSFFPNLGPEFVIVTVLPVAFCGGMVNFISAAYSYVSDVTPEEKRFFRIGMLEFVLGLGVFTGLFLLSVAFKVTTVHQYMTVYGVCAVSVLLVTALTHFFLPESLQNTESGKGLLSVFELKHFKEMVSVCFKKRDGYKRLVIFLSIACLTITLSAGTGGSNVLYLYTRLRFGWNIQDFSFWASIALATFFLGLFLGLMILSKWLKIHESILGFLSYLTHVTVSFYIAFIPPNSGHLMYYTGLVNILGGLSGPICRAILSKSVPKDDVGKVYALTSSSEAFFPLIFGPLYTLLYNSTIQTLPNAFLLFTGVLYIVCATFFVIIYVIHRRYPQVVHEELENNNDNQSGRVRNDDTREKA